MPSLLRFQMAPVGQVGRQAGSAQWLQDIFSWAQCRLMLPGWFGFGAAVAAWREKHGDAGMALLAHYDELEQACREAAEPALKKLDRLLRR